MYTKKRKYHHLSAGTGAGRIANILGVHRSTIYREIKRNKHRELNQYLPDSAQTLSLKRKHHFESKIKSSKRLQKIIRNGIAMYHSPEVIAGRLKQEQSTHIISHESIYKWIYGDAKDEKLLRRKRHRGFRLSAHSSLKCTK